MKTLANIVISLMLFVSVGHAQDYVPGEIIVKYKKSAADGTKGNGRGYSSNGPMHKLVSGKRIKVKRNFARFGMQKLGVQDNSNIKDMIREIKADPNVEYAEPNYLLDKLDMGQNRAWSISRTDFLESQSVSAQATSAYDQSGADVSVVEAWAESSSLSALPYKPIVAVIDTGVDYNHEIFTQSDSIWRNSGEIAGNGIDDDKNGYVDDIRGWDFGYNDNNPMDDEGHGTHVAGIVLGATQDILADQLEEAKVKIMPLKFLGSDGSGSTSDAIEAIHYAVDNGAHVLNNSWGGKQYSAALHEALAYTYEHEVLFVAAAGNYGEDNNSKPVYPASYDTPNILAVAASDDWDSLASFSNYGSDTVDIAAPGVAIISAYPGQYYSQSSGTSMAAPFAAGVAALAYREALDLTGFQIKELLVSSGDVISAFRDKLTEPVRVNAFEAMVSAKFAIGTSAYQPSYSLKTSSSSSRSVASSDSIGGCGLVQDIYRSAVENGRRGYREPRGGMPPLGLVIVLLLAPVLVLHMAREGKKKTGADKRRFERFKMDSQVRVAVGGREIVGSLSTISLGGCSFNVDNLIEKGGVVNMQIASPDGKEVLEVKGEIVWSAAQKSYGVRFAEMQSSNVLKIADWTRNLIRSN